jgi:hypothetical protein
MRNGVEATFVGINIYLDNYKYIFAHANDAALYSYLEIGRSDGFSNHFDIICKKPEKITKWVNVYADNRWVAYDTKQDAGRSAGMICPTACIQITYEEGEGL